MRDSRQKRDSNDIKKIANILESISPFNSDCTLRNIFTGVTAEEVNVDKLHFFGMNIISKMIDKDVFRYSAKRSDKVRTLGSAGAVCSKDDLDIQVDPALLFQRMMTVATCADMNLVDIMRYELCAYPAALFESQSQMRKSRQITVSRSNYQIHQTY